MSTLRVCLHHSGGWIARAIRWQTRSYWNHASVLVGNTLVEALPGPGVSARRTLDTCEAIVAAKDSQITTLTAQVTNEAKRSPGFFRRTAKGFQWLGAGVILGLAIR